VSGGIGAANARLGGPGSNYPKRRGDEQERDRRCDVGGASGHVTMKPSICNRPTFYESRVYAVNVSSLTPGGLSGVEGATEPRAIARGSRGVGPA
jgi:hypothetical protein